MSRIVDRIAFGIIGALAFALIAVLAGIAGAGPLDPPGAPGSSMRTLDEVSGSWSRNLSATGGCDSPRFDCVLADAAVLDRNTGLVWERFPNFTGSTFSNVLRSCADSAIGQVKGWRLPTAEELASLVQPGASNPALPAGHPFGGSVQNLDYWTTTFVGATDNATLRLVNMGTGSVQGTLSATNSALFWCVRAGQGYDGLR